MKQLRVLEAAKVAKEPPIKVSKAMSSGRLMWKWSNGHRVTTATWIKRWRNG